MHTKTLMLIGRPVHPILLCGLTPYRRPTTLASASPYLSSKCSCTFSIISSNHPSFPFRGNDNPPSPQAPPSQLPQRPPSARYSGKSRSKPKCNRATPSFCDVEKRWYCSACITFFRDNYECVRHIENVGKRAKCLPCGKTVCARKDNRKRHYTMYCKRKDLGKNMGLRLDDTFEDVT